MPAKLDDYTDTKPLTIFALDDDPTFKDRKIYLDHEGLRGNKRRYFRTYGAFAYAELFVKNAKGNWVGEVSGAVGMGQRLIRTKYGNWILNTYSVKEEEKKGNYPRQFLSDSGEEYFDGMNKGTWGTITEADAYRLVQPHEAQRWLLQAGYDLASAEFAGIDFDTKRVPGVYALGAEPADNEDKPAREV